MDRTVNLSMQELDRRARTYMFGHSACKKPELKARLDEALSDAELTGKLRETVLQRYRELIKA